MARLIVTALDLLGINVEGFQDLATENQQLRRELSEAVNLIDAIREKLAELNTALPVDNNVD